MIPTLVKEAVAAATDHAEASITLRVPEGFFARSLWDFDPDAYADVVFFATD